MDINKQIKIMIQELTDNNIPCTKCTITKAYQDSTICDIKTEHGSYKMINSNLQASANDTGLLVFLDGDMSKPYVLVTKDVYTKAEIDEIIEEIIGGQIDLRDYVKKIEVEDALDSASTLPVQNKVIKSSLDEKSDINHNHNDLYYTKNSINSLLNNKQDTLVSGTNIKTINNQSLLGNGDLTINPQITIDDSLSYDSTNPVQNNTITTALSYKAPFSHAHTTNRHGLGDLDYYGHVKIINNLSETSYTDGLVLSAYQGYVLKTLIDAKSDFSGSYNDLTDKPTIPSKTSDLTNDSGFITASDISGKEDKTNKVNAWNSTTTDTNYPSEKLVKDSLDGKVDKVAGKGLSTNDFTNTYKNKIDDLATVATTGSYNDLSDKPSIPNKTSDITNDSGFITASDITGKEDKTNKVNAWNSITTDINYPSEKLVKDSLDAKQDTLVSGTNIKTINNESLLGSGNITIQGGGTITVDDQLSNQSENPVQNKIITTALSVKAPIYHASPNTTYGLGNTTDYGHVKIINDLNEISYENGAALAAYQGAVLKDLIDAKSDFSGNYNDLTGKPNVVFLELTSSDYTPDINDNFTLTLKAVDIFGNPVSNYNAGTLKENGFDVYDTNRNQIGANVITDANGEWSATIPCYNLQSELYLQNGNSEAMLWSLRDYSVGDSHCQVQAEGWYYYNNTSTYKLSRNGYLARFSLHGWSTGTVLTSTSWTNFGGGTAYAADIIPISHVIMLTSGCNAYFRINTNGTIVCRAVSSNVASGTAHYGSVTWSCEK